MCTAGRMSPFRAIFWSMRTMLSMTLLSIRSTRSSLFPVFSQSSLAQSCTFLVSRTGCWYPCLLLLQGGGGLVSHHFSKPTEYQSPARARAVLMPVVCLSLLFLLCVLGTHIDQMKRKCLVWNDFTKTLVLERSFKQHKTYSRLGRYFVVTVCNVLHVILDLFNVVDGKCNRFGMHESRP